MAQHCTGIVLCGSCFVGCKEQVQLIDPDGEETLETDDDQYSAGVDEDAGLALPCPGIGPNDSRASGIASHGGTGDNATLKEWVERTARQGIHHVVKWMHSFVNT